MDDYDALIPDFDEDMVFLCKTDAMAFKERLHDSRRKLLDIVPETETSKRLHDAALARLDAIEAQVEIMMDELLS
jgi:hypothetical protein